MAAEKAAAAVCHAYLCWLTECSRTAMTKAGRLISGVLVAMIIAAAPVSAQPAIPESQADLAAYIATEYYSDRLTTYLVGYETWIGPCPDPEPLELVGTYLQDRSVSLPGAPDLGALQWVEIVSVGGCSVPYQRLVYVSLKEDEPVFYARLLGNTQTSPRLEHDAVRTVVEQEHEAAVLNGCPVTFPLRILSTVSGDRFDTEYGEGWDETWTVLDCHGAREITLQFQPDHTGGTAIDITSANVTAAPQ